VSPGEGEGWGGKVIKWGNWRGKAREMCERKGGMRGKSRRGKKGKFH